MFRSSLIGFWPSRRNLRKTIKKTFLKNKGKKEKINITQLLLWNLITYFLKLYLYRTIKYETLFLEIRQF